MRIVHLGLGNFFRAHQAWYTDNASDAAEWGIAAFTGRSTALADALTAQDGLYTLITRAAAGDSCQVLGSVSKAHPGTDTRAWLDYLADPEVRIVTLTVTEAGYVRGSDGGLDAERPDIQSDLVALRGDIGASVRTTPGPAGGRARGSARRRRRPVGGGVVRQPARERCRRRPCGDRFRRPDSIPAWPTGSSRTSRSSPPWSTGSPRRPHRTTSWPSPHSPAAPMPAPVVTEPFTEWVLSGEFPGGRPAWEDAGARFVDDITPFEERKLWLLNGAHSLLAYAGSARGHQTIAEAVTDPVCRGLDARVVDRSFPPPHPAAGRKSLTTGMRCWSGSPTHGSGTCSPRSPPTDPRSCPSGSCRPSATNGPRAGSRWARCGRSQRGSTTSAAPGHR